MNTQIIAEIGWNHMGNMELAEKMISEASRSGADFCKFQTNLGIFSGSLRPLGTRVPERTPGPRASQKYEHVFRVDVLRG